MLHITSRQLSRHLTLGVVLALTVQSALAHAQQPASKVGAPHTTASPRAAGAPVLDRRTAKVVRTALERAALLWGTARVLDGTASGTASAPAVLTGSTAAAALALAHAAALVGASALTVHLHASRAGSIARYGNPYGLPAGDIAFPLLRRTRTGQSRPALPAPYPVPTPVPTPDDDDTRPRLGRLYATYSRYNRTTGLFYAGRTSAVIDLDQPWRPQARAAVKARHHNRQTDEALEPPADNYRNAVLDTYAVGFAVAYQQRYRDAGYLAIRGREQQLIDFHGARRAAERRIASFVGGARSDTGAGEALTDNAIRGVAKDNPLGQIFHSAANLHFGQMAPYTGHRRRP